MQKDAIKIQKHQFFRIEENERGFFNSIISATWKQNLWSQCSIYEVISIPNAAAAKVVALVDKPCHTTST